MNDLSKLRDESLLAAWIRYETEPLRANREADFWAVAAIDDLIYEKPKDAWSLILSLLQSEKLGDFVEVLSAGHLEDLLSRHGVSFIDTIEQEARVNPNLAFALGGVWQNGMSDEIYTRVQAVWNRSGWDGNP